MSLTIRERPAATQASASQQARMTLLQSLLQCKSCSAGLIYEQTSYVCSSCAARYPIIDGIPRFVPAAFIERDDAVDTTLNNDLSRKTKNYFGFEWDYFRDWGFIPDEEAAKDGRACGGGSVSDRARAFQSKCRMDEQDLRPESIVLDAGCGNGRYSYEAARRGPRLVVAVDIGYGAVTSARDNTRDFDNVVVVQANLHELPFRAEVFDACFSNGVLMHTGDARRAFREVARTLRPGGSFVAHVYQHLNARWEENDRLLRNFTTGLSIEDNLELAKILSELARFLDRFPGALARANEHLRLQCTEHHMFDWYSAPIATHHSYAEVAAWFAENGFALLDSLPANPDAPTGDWACNLKGRKR